MSEFLCPSEPSMRPAGRDARRPMLSRVGTAPASLMRAQSSLSSRATDESPQLHRVSSFNTLSEQAERKFWWVRLCVVVVYFGVGLLLGHHEGWSMVFSLYFSVETLTTVGYGDFKFRDDCPNFQLCVAIFVLMGVLVMGAALTGIFKSAYETQRKRMEKLLKEHSQVENCRSSASSRSRCRGRLGHLGEASVIYKQALVGLRTNLYQCTAVFLGILVLGASIVGGIEGWDWRKSFYWACVTFTSVGFGDVVPDSKVSQVATMLLMLLGVLVVGSCAGFFGSYVSFVREARLREEVLTQFGTELTGEELESLAHGDEIKSLDISASDECILRSEFVLFMLVKLGRVEEQELKACQAAFDCLDVTNTGALTQKDLELHDEVRALRQRRAEAACAQAHGH